MANRIVSVHAGIYGMGIYAIMLPSSGFSVAHSILHIHYDKRIDIDEIVDISARLHTRQLELGSLIRKENLYF